MSALPPKADILQGGFHIRYVPITDLGALSRQTAACSRRCSFEIHARRHHRCDLRDWITPREEAQRTRMRLDSCAYHRSRSRQIDRRWQMIELAILGAKVGDIGLGAHRPTGRTLDKFVRLKLASMLIEMLAQPSMQRIEFTDCYLTRNFGMCFESGSVELRTQNVADGV